MARMAGSDITASPSQLVARTNTFDMEDGLKATNFQNSKSGIRHRLVHPSDSSDKTVQVERFLFSPC
jgi:hypothetical protein